MSDLKGPLGDYNPPRSERAPSLRRSRLPRWAAPVAAGTATVALLAGGAVLRIAAADPQAPALLDRLLVLLLGAAFLIAALLAFPRAPRLTWALLAIGATIGLLEVVAVVRALEPSATGEAWRDLVLLAGLALGGGVGVAAGYADVNRWDASRLARGLVAAVLVGVLATIGLAAWAVVLAARSEPAAQAPGELSALRFATRVALLTIVGAFALGVARDVWPAVSRATDRLGADPAASGDRLWRYLGYLADELIPGRAAARRRLAEQERARIAADLHALVLPDLRRAATAAAQAGAPEAMQLDLRRALEDVEQLMHERQSIVLEQFGLVAALEWLAERTEERSPLRVELDLGASVPDRPGAIDPVVARAAFRIALLGLDNVVRHGNAGMARLYLTLDRGGLRLAINDDGTGPAAPERLFERPGDRSGRGIADMRAEAIGTGGEIDIVTEPGGRIDARWPLERVRGNHAGSVTRSADGSGGRRT